MESKLKPKKKKEPREAEITDHQGVTSIQETILFWNISAAAYREEVVQCT